MARHTTRSDLRPDYPHPDGYALSFGQGLEWHLFAHESAVDFGGRLARLLGLAPHAAAGPRRPRLVVTRDADHFAMARPVINPDGMWSETLDLGGLIRAKLAYRTRDAILHLPHPPDHEMDQVACAMAVFPAFQAALTRGGLPMHGALVEREGRGAIISAAGGAGKSTCARRIPLPWRALCDDEVLIVARGDGTYSAHPLPTWSDLFFQHKASPRIWRSGLGVRLAGIYFLEQAEVDRATPLERRQAPMRITQASLQTLQRFLHQLPSARKRELQRQVFDNACQLAGRVASLGLEATLSGRFWEQMA
jgi:SynChlorMet cassette protein ScmC